jgi:hypothetical protein
MRDEGTITSAVFTPRFAGLRQSNLLHPPGLTSTDEGRSLHIVTGNETRGPSPTIARLAALLRKLAQLQPKVSIIFLVCRATDMRSCDAGIMCTTQWTQCIYVEKLLRVFFSREVGSIWVKILKIGRGLDVEKAQNSMVFALILR